MNENFVVLVRSKFLSLTSDSMNVDRSVICNDLTIGWQNLNLLSHSNAILAPQARQARPSGEILNYLLRHFSDILSMIIGSVIETGERLFEYVLILISI